MPQQATSILATPPARPLLARFVNLTGRTLDKFGIQKPPFNAEAIRKAAARKSGHVDFGSDSYQAGLEALLYSIEYESRLHPLGRMAVWQQIVEGLANRLTVVAWEKANPDLAVASVPAPLIILGLGRTGTTILQETLAAAPGMRTPVTWEITDYSLLNSVTDPRSDKRVQRIDANIARTDKMIPGFSAIHYYDAFTPSECIGLTAMDLASEQFSALAWAPTYRKFLLSHDDRTVYDWHRRGLRYLQATTPDVRWVLKAPMHSAYLGAVLNTYPDAMIVHAHRDPLEVIGSLCSLYATLRRGFSDHVPVQEQAAADARYTADVIDIALKYRREHPEDEKRFCDIAFRDFIGDQTGTLARIYDYFGLDLTHEARAAMQTYLDSRPRDKYGTHSYSLDQFGLTAQGLEPLFADYLQRFADFI